ncbi:carbohydrate-binding family 9-like protein [Mangrovibacterium sp.]|uniref:carbohydrate-binding family 9-like protein n=1 Tax=Mangrovibacterium sp. TaxID=1961364 RepID=UPI003565DCE6
MKKIEGLKMVFLLMLVATLGCTQLSSQPVLKADTSPKIPYNPEQYVCFRTETHIVVDGVLDDKSWEQAPWSNEFVDIEGSLQPKPTFATRVKMLWDSDYFYIAAELEEPHIWANITEHDEVMFYDNDFEVFIDPDGDTHNYYEFEMNALNATWDLLLTKPYRDGALVVDSWEIPGLQSAVKIYGTLNDPTDQDEKWTIELAFPWKVLRECNPGQKIPEDGSQWRLGFSRVEWQTEIIDGKYVKKKGANGKNLPESNWVWSPQGVIAMHQPETWGYVQFSAKTNDAAFVQQADEDVKWALRQLYYRQKAYQAENNEFTDNLSALRMAEVKLNEKAFQPEITCYPTGFIASYPSLTEKGNWYIREDGKVWFEKN